MVRSFRALLACVVVTLMLVTPFVAAETADTGTEITTDIDTTSLETSTGDPPAADPPPDASTDTGDTSTETSSDPLPPLDTSTVSEQTTETGTMPPDPPVDTGTTTDTETEPAPDTTTDASGEASSELVTEMETETDTDTSSEVSTDTGPTLAPINARSAAPEDGKSDIGILAVGDRIVVATITTDEPGGVPAGTELCIWDSVEYCQEWIEGVTTSLTFTVYSLNAEYYLSLPSDSGLPSQSGWVAVPAGQTVNLDLVIEPAAPIDESTVALAPDDPALLGSQICVYTGFSTNCDAWAGTPIPFPSVEGTVSFQVYPPANSGYQPLNGGFEIPAGGIDYTIQMERGATIRVTLQSSDGSPVPPYTYVGISDAAEFFQAWVGDELVFTVSPGTKQYEVLVSPGFSIPLTSGSVTVGAGEDIDLVITYDPPAPGVVRIYTTTANGEPIPEGIEACVDVNAWTDEEDIDDLCQPVTGDVTEFLVPPGFVRVTITPPLGSPYPAVDEGLYIVSGEVIRFNYVIEEKAEPGNLEIIVSTSDAMPIGWDDAEACVIPTGQSAASCPGASYPVGPNLDGSFSFVASSLLPGTYDFYVYGLEGYSAASGSITVLAGQETTQTVVLEPETETASVIVHLTTADGEPVPNPTEICTVIHYQADACAIWAGDPVTLTTAPGVIVIEATPPWQSPYFQVTSAPVWVTPGETIDVYLTLFTEDAPVIISKTASADTVRSGEQVTFTITVEGARSREFETLRFEIARFAFTISDTLPAELSDITVTCAGDFGVVATGSCYELDGNILTAFGPDSRRPLTSFAMSVTVTGTVTGDAGTVVSNTACVVPGFGRYIPASSTQFASMSFDNLALQVIRDEPGSFCDSASVTIVAPPEDPTPTPTSPAPSPSPSPTSPAPSPSPTEPGPSPSPTEPGATATATATAPAPTQAPGDPTVPSKDPTTIPSSPVVTALPNTGAGGPSTLSVLLYAGMAAALLFALAGLLVNTRSRR